MVQNGEVCPGPTNFFCKICSPQIIHAIDRIILLIFDSNAIEFIVRSINFKVYFKIHNTKYIKSVVHKMRRTVDNTIDNFSILRPIEQYNSLIKIINSTISKFEMVLKIKEALGESSLL